MIRRLDHFIATHDYGCWCGSRVHSVFCKQGFGRVFAALECNVCGTQRLLPRALAEEQSAVEIYNSDTYARGQFSDDVTTQGTLRTLERMEEVGVRISGGATVLDIGCSEGSLLGEIRRRYGSCCVGVDIDQRAIAKARDRYPGITFYHALIQDTKGKLPKADLIIASAILEHVMDPETFVAELSAQLKPGGQLFLLTPNTGSLYYRLARSWWRELLALGEHVYLFDPKSLEFLAAKVGMKVDGIGSGYDNIIWPRLRLPINMRSVGVFLWASYRSLLKVLSRSISGRLNGDIIYARLLAHDEDNG